MRKRHKQEYQCVKATPTILGGVRSTVVIRRIIKSREAERDDTVHSPDKTVEKKTKFEFVPSLRLAKLGMRRAFR